MLLTKLYLLFPFSFPFQEAKTLVNGIALEEPKVLNHLDRILFGSSHLYLFKNPLNKRNSGNLPEDIDWEFAQQEIAEAEGWKCKDTDLTDGKKMSLKSLDLKFYENLTL